MKSYLIGILLLVFPIYGYAEGYLPNSVNLGIIDFLGDELLEKEQGITSVSEVVSSSIIKTELYTKDNRAYANMRTQREMLLSVIRLSVTKKISIDEEIDVFGRVGVYNYQIEALTRRHSSRNSSVFHWGSVGRETAPIASVGIEAKPFKHFLFRAEYQRAGPATSSSLSVLYKFK